MEKIKMLKTTITVLYDGILSIKDLGQLLMKAQYIDNFKFMEVMEEKEPEGIVTYSYHKEKKV